jgi:flavodoxin
MKKRCGAALRNDMPACIVYSSVTGNTRSIAEHLSARFALPVFPVRNAPYPEAFDTFLLGFWTKRGAPDECMAAFMRRLKNKKVFIFGTMTAFPDSPHARQCSERAATLLENGSNRIIGHFLCQGRLDPAVFARSSHPKTEERLYRIRCAATHPDTEDFLRAEANVRSAMELAC